MTYKAILFDVGDTLLEHHPGQKQMYLERMEALGFAVDPSTADEIAAAVEKAAHEQIAKEQGGAPRMPDGEFDAMLDRAALNCIMTGQDETAYMEKLSGIPLPEQALRMIPGTLETLAALKGRGFRLAVVSNHRAWLPEYLSKIGLADYYFEAIIVSDVVGYEKPDVRIMQIALEQLCLEAPECLYVGDHPFDVLCAKKTGMDCAWLAAQQAVLPESVPYKEDYRISALSELLSL